MEVTPTVLREGKIILNLKISQNMPGLVIKQSDNVETLAIDKQEIQTQVTVSDGETIVLGGIFQQQKIEGNEKYRCWVHCFNIKELSVGDVNW